MQHELTLNAYDMVHMEGKSAHTWRYPIIIDRTLHHFVRRATQRATQVAQGLGHRYPWADPYTDYWLMDLLSEPMKRFGIFVDYTDIIEEFLRASANQIELQYWNIQDINDLVIDHEPSY